ncbi:MAG: tRNA (adenosine(37)-N6)-threonylcarbamoyltransferase complex dimerization subunit type 1 TsaB [Candidatus Omnitrophica bacterium]|nr:tRNA (adenosine(37)-N6)-threonylcarbamoyltransferase complex dimerization subunit type 1 TsaB [Candidatus Omnitrophota bacterium]
MFLLSIECSVQKTGIAILQDCTVLEKKIWKSKDTSRELLPAIDNLFKSTGMKPQMFDYFVVSSGPGSWTGIRLGLSIAYGLSIADDKKVYGISSLECIAYKFKKDSYVGVVLPSIGDFVHYVLLKKPSELEKKHVKIYSCRIDKLIQKMAKAEIIASPSKKILSLFAGSGKSLKTVFPDPVLNAQLAIVRIKNHVNPKNHPYYEK